MFCVVKNQKLLLQKLLRLEQVRLSVKRTPTEKVGTNSVMYASFEGFE